MQAAVTGEQQQQGGDVDMAGQMGFEEVQQEAAAKQRAFESQQTKASTSGSGQATGVPGAALIAPLPPLLATMRRISQHVHADHLTARQCPASHGQCLRQAVPGRGMAAAACVK